MKKYTLKILADPQQACKAAAEYFVTAAQQAIEDHGRFTVALAGGDTPRTMYQFLTRPPLRSRLDWSRVLFFWGDERPVPPDHADSNFGMAQETLLAPLHIAENQVFRIRAEQPDKIQAAQDYQNLLAQTLGTTPSGEIIGLNLVLLGLGADCHTASLFPATPALLETRRWFTANPVFKLDCTRLTLTPMFINRADQVCFLVTGKDKAAALKEVLEGSIDTQRLPAQLVKPVSGNLVWFVDEAAASVLEKK
jgi:6-phosphogluconolactonase